MDLTTEIKAAIEESNAVTEKLHKRLEEHEEKWGGHDPATFDFEAGGEAKKR